MPQCSNAPNAPMPQRPQRAKCTKPHARRPICSMPLPIGPVPNRPSAQSQAPTPDPRCPNLTRLLPCPRPVPPLPSTPTMTRIRPKPPPCPNQVSSPYSPPSSFLPSTRPSSRRRCGSTWRRRRCSKATPQYRSRRRGRRATTRMTMRTPRPWQPTRRWPQWPPAERRTQRCRPRRTAHARASAHCEPGARASCGLHAHTAFGPLAG